MIFQPAQMPQHLLKISLAQPSRRQIIQFPECLVACDFYKLFQPAPISHRLHDLVGEKAHCSTLISLSGIFFTGNIIFIDLYTPSGR